MRRVPRGVVVTALVIVAALGLVLAFTSGDDDARDETATSSSATSTTLATGGIDVDAPRGFRAIPLPSFDIGIALPDDWAATRTDAEAIAALEGQPLDNPEFLAAARRAAAFGAVLYGAGVDDDDRVTDVQLRIYDRGRATSAHELRQFAASVADRAKLRDVEIAASAADGDPVVRIDFDAGTEDTPARGTEMLRADGDRIVSVVVTSERRDRAGHDALVGAIVGSLVLR